MTNIKLIAVDLDGTLLKSDSTPAPDGISALQEALNRGIHVVIATARRLDSVQSYCKKLEICTEPLICFDGGLILESAWGNIWQQHTIPLAVAQDITRLADEHDWECAIVVGETTFLRQRPNQTLGATSDGRYVVPKNSDMITNREPMRIFINQLPAITGIQAWFNDAKVSDTTRLELFYDKQRQVRACGVFPAKADKGTALTYVCEKLGIDLSQTMAIGDNTNDLAMLKIAGISIAMGNAHDSVKQSASYVAPSNDDEGVAWAVRRFVLDENGT